MAVRALIIAIQNYDAVTVGGIAKKLPGTLQAGLDFRAWLVKKWAAEERATSETQVLFCSEPAQPGGRGATRRDILQSLLQLKQDGQNTTDELFVFFSGHGFAFIEKPGSRADVLLSSDFETPELSSASCMNLDEIVTWLREHLGPGRHFYFVDACRNPLDASKIQVGPLLPVDPNTSAEASTFVLQSTMDGATAAVGGAFPATLLAGLGGRGKAKVWDENVSDAMLVKYDSLRRFVKAALSENQPIASRVEGSEGEGDVTLATLRPVPLSQCTVQILNVGGQDAGELSLKRHRSAADERRPLGSQPLVFEVEPDNYALQVLLTNATVIPSDAVPVDLFEDRTVVFAKVDASTVVLESAVAAEPDVVDVDVVVPPGSGLWLRNLQQGTEIRFISSKTVSLSCGRYAATIAEPDGRISKRADVDVVPGTTAINLGEWRHSAPHLAIARHLPATGDGVDFSESLGGLVTNNDLNLWLALAGGGRILGSTGDYSKLARLPLHDFSNETPGASPIYVLAGLEDPEAKLRVGISRNADVVWRDAVQPAGMPGIMEAYLQMEQGWWLVSFGIEGAATYTVASLASPNRAMLITLTLDGDGNPCLAQFLLPLGHLLHKLPVRVREQIQRRNQLRDVRFLAQASHAFRRRRDLSKEVSADDLESLLYAKWLDPIASSLAAYELLRRGRKASMSEVVGNMRVFFPDLPDTAALAKLNGEPIGRPAGVPLFLDGLRAFSDYANWLPLPAGHLDFTSPWTAWRAAVR